MARAMFEYTKTVLKKVSFDPNLFNKELEKATKNLLPHELIELKIYIKSIVLQNPNLNQSLIFLG